MCCFLELHYTYINADRHVIVGQVCMKGYIYW